MTILDSDQPGAGVMRNLRPTVMIGVGGSGSPMVIANDDAHRMAREQRVSGLLYWLVKHGAELVFRVLCGFTAVGTDNVPRHGPVVIVPGRRRSRRRRSLEA